VGSSSCAGECTTYGTCNEQLQRCDCPVGRTGDDCSVVSMPACELIPGWVNPSTPAPVAPSSAITPVFQPSVEDRQRGGRGLMFGVLNADALDWVTRVQVHNTLLHASHHVQLPEGVLHGMGRRERHPGRAARVLHHAAQRAAHQRDGPHAHVHGRSGAAAHERRPHGPGGARRRRPREARRAPAGAVCRRVPPARLVQRAHAMHVLRGLERTSLANVPSSLRHAGLGPSVESF
jgi:hypothetical protein